MTGRGHVPQRKCTGCGRQTAKSELVRFTAGRTGGEKTILMDPAQTAGGRGMYICPRLSCFETATGRRRSFQRRFPGAALDPELREKFIRLIEAG